MSNKTADGLRDRLFDALDALIEKKIDKSEVEGICYLSEQILKTAEIELDIIRENHKAIDDERQHQLKIKREDREAKVMLTKTIEHLGNVEDVAQS